MLLVWISSELFAPRLGSSELQYAPLTYRNRPSLFDYINIETERTEAIVTTYHCTHGILHPPIVKVALATSQRLHKLTHGIPSGRTHPSWAFAVYGYPLLSLSYIACMLNGILKLLHQIRIDSLADGSDSYLIHNHGGQKEVWLSDSEERREYFLSYFTLQLAKK